MGTYRKYNNKKCEVDGIKFDSKREAERYLELKIMERAGAITALVLQPKYELTPKFKKNGKTYRAMYYIADFEYIENEQKVAEDLKGFKTDVYKIKSKLFEYLYPGIKFVETH